MEQKQNCKIQYGLKGYTAKHSVREASGTQNARKIVFLIPLTTCILAIALKRLFWDASLLESYENSKLKCSVQTLLL